MMVLNLDKWLGSLPPWELDLPIVYVEGRYWTPREIADQVSRGGDLAMKLIAALAALPRAPPQDLRELAKERLLTLLEMQPVEVVVFSLEKPHYTAEELKDLISRDVGFGSEMIDNEIKWIFGFVLKGVV